MWEDASSLNFIEVDSDQADMVLGLFDFASSAGTQNIDGFAFFPGESLISGDVFINEGSSSSLSLYLVGYSNALVSFFSFGGLGSLTYGDMRQVTNRVTNFGEEAFGGGMDVALVLSLDEALSTDDISDLVKQGWRSGGAGRIG